MPPGGGEEQKTDLDGPIFESRKMRRLVGWRHMTPQKKALDLVILIIALVNSYNH